MWKRFVFLAGIAINGILVAVCTFAAILGFVGLLADTDMQHNRVAAIQFAVVAGYGAVNGLIAILAFRST